MSNENPVSVKKTAFPRLFTSLAKIPRPVAIFLSTVPFLVMSVLYVFYSSDTNPMMPLASDLFSGFCRMAFQADPRSGQYLLWVDLGWSLYRLLIAILVSAVVGFFWGSFVGFYPILQKLFLQFTVFISALPTVVLVPVLFQIFGNDDGGKIALLTAGLVPILSREIGRAVSQSPTQLKILAISLGAKTSGLLRHVVFPVAWTRLLVSLEVLVSFAFVLLVFSETIKANAGLGYRIYQTRRSFDMTVIIPYALVTAAVSAFLSYLISWLLRWTAPWFEKAE